MFCRKCGAEIPDNSKFCTKCGTKVEINSEGKSAVIPAKNSNDQKKRSKLAVDFSEDVKLYTDEELKIGDEFESNIKVEADNAGKKSEDENINEKVENTLKSRFTNIFKKSKNKKSKKSKNKKNKSKNKKNSKDKDKSKKDKVKKSKKKKPKKPKKPKKSKKNKSNDKAKGNKEKRGFLFFGKKKTDKSDKAKTDGKEKKPKNKIKKILIALIILIIIAFGLTFTYFKFGADFFADSNAKKILLSTYDEYYTNYDDKYVFPDSYIDPGEKYLQEKYNYSIDYAKGGLINEDVLSSLQGISLEIIRIDSLSNNEFYQYAKVDDQNKNKISAELSNTKSEFKLYIPEFYDKVLTATNEYVDTTEETEDTDKKTFTLVHDEFISNREKWSNTLESFKLVKYSFGSPFDSFIAANIEATVFEISERNDDGKAIKYKATLDGATALTNLSELLTALNEDENISLILSNIKYVVSNMDSLKDTELASGTILSETVSDFNEIIDGGRATDVEIEFNLNDSLDAIERVEISTVLNDLETEITFDFDSGVSYQNVVTNLSFSDTDTEIGFCYKVKSFKNDNEEYTKNEDFTLFVKSSVEEANAVVKDMREVYDIYGEKEKVAESESDDSTNENLNSGETSDDFTADLADDEIPSEEDITGEEIDYGLLTNEDEIVTEFKLTGETIYNLPTGNYSKKYYFDAGNFFDILRINYSDQGTYKSTDTSRKFNQIIDINYDTVFYKYDVNISGNIDKNIVDEIGNISFEDNYNLDFASEVDYNSIKEKINENWNKFLDEFSSGEW